MLASATLNVMVDSSSTISPADKVVLSAVSINSWFAKVPLVITRVALVFASSALNDTTLLLATTTYSRTEITAPSPGSESNMICVEFVENSVFAIIVLFVMTTISFESDTVDRSNAGPFVEFAVYVVGYTLTPKTKSSATDAELAARLSKYSSAKSCALSRVTTSRSCFTVSN